MEDYSHLTRPELERLREEYDNRYWNAMDYLASITVSRAAVLNALQACENYNCANVDNELIVVENK